MGKTHENKDSSKEKAIFLSQFENKVSDGLTRFVVLDATYDEIKTKKGETSEVIKLNVELTDVDKPSNSMELKNHLLFVNYSPGGVFHDFIKAFLEATHSTAFTPSALVGRKGKVELSHYKPNGAEFAYARLTNWVFDASANHVTKALKKYEDDIAEDDIDF